MKGENMENIKKNGCHFLGSKGKCEILKYEDCSGFNKACSFFKTSKDFYAEHDRSIDICRAKGLCKSCKYKKNSSGGVTACRKSDEA